MWPGHQPNRELKKKIKVFYVRQKKSCYLECVFMLDIARLIKCFHYQTGSPFVTLAGGDSITFAVKTLCCLQNIVAIGTGGGVRTRNVPAICCKPCCHPQSAYLWSQQRMKKCFKIMKMSTTCKCFLRCPCVLCNWLFYPG